MPRHLRLNQQPACLRMGDIISHLVAQQLVHQTNDFLWCQRPPYVVVVFQRLRKIFSGGYVAAIHLRVHNLCGFDRRQLQFSLHVSHPVRKLTHLQCAHGLEQGERLIFHELPCI